MSVALSGWRDWCIALLAILDCLAASSFLPTETSFCFIVGHLISISFQYFIPLLLFLHYIFDGFRWQLYPLYCQLVLVSVLSQQNVSKLSLLASNNYYELSTAVSSSLTNSPNFSGVPLVPTTISNFASSVSSIAENITGSQGYVGKNKVAQLVFYNVFSRFTQLSTSFIVIFLRCGKKFYGVAKAFFLLISLLMCYLFPVPLFPEPEGGWGCGVEEFQFVATDVHQQLPTIFNTSSTKESSNNNGTVPRIIFKTNTIYPSRRFNCLVFYPIENHRHKNDSRYSWLPLGIHSIHAISSLLGIPNFFFTYLLRLETHSIMMAPLSKKRKKYPIIFLSHGIGCNKTSQTILCEALASQGFIVVAIEHTDGTSLTTGVSPTLPTASHAQPQKFLGSISIRTTSILPPSDLQRSRRKLPKPIQLYPFRKAVSKLTRSSSEDSNDASQQIWDDAMALSELMGGQSASSLHAGRQSSKASQEMSGTNDKFSTSFTGPHQSGWSSELEFRHSQLLIRAGEIRAAHAAMAQMSETSGCWLKDRVDWDASSIVGFGFGGASALLACIFDHIILTTNRPQRPLTTSRVMTGVSSISSFKTCVLLSPWLDAIKASELRLSDWVTEADIFPNFGRLPQNFLVINTAEQVNKRLNNQIRLIKLIKDAFGDKTILQFSRCQRLDFTDIPILSPHIFRWLNLSGPRSPQKTSLMVNRVVFNFVNRHYRRSLFTVDSGFGNSCGANGLSRQRRTGKSFLSPGSGAESDAAGGLVSVGSVSDASSTTTTTTSGAVIPSRGITRGMTVNRHPSMTSVPEMVKTRFWSSTLQALRLAGVPDHYIRGLGGLRSPAISKELSRMLLRCKVNPGERSYLYYDITEGVLQFADEEDTKKQKKISGGQQLYVDNTVAEVCYI